MKKLDEEKCIVIYRLMYCRMCDDVCTAGTWCVAKGGGGYYVKSEEDMKKLFPYALEAIENTQKIADRCHVEIEFGVTKLPKYGNNFFISSSDFT